MPCSETNEIDILDKKIKELYASMMADGLEYGFGSLFGNSVCEKIYKLEEAKEELKKSLFYKPKECLSYPESLDQYR